MNDAPPIIVYEEPKQDSEEFIKAIVSETDKVLEGMKNGSKFLTCYNCEFESDDYDTCPKCRSVFWISRTSHYIKLNGELMAEKYLYMKHNLSVDLVIYYIDKNKMILNRTLRIRDISQVIK